MKYLSWVLYPLVLGYGIYSLIYEPHKSWYSWLLNSLVGAVYTFGFILMCPQARSLTLNLGLRNHCPASRCWLISVIQVSGRHMTHRQDKGLSARMCGPSLLLLTPAVSHWQYSQAFACAPVRSACTSCDTLTKAC